jgi:hypothetical protein
MVEIGPERMQIEIAGRAFGYVADPVVAEHREGHPHQEPLRDAHQPARVVPNDRNRMTSPGTPCAVAFCAAFWRRPVRLRFSTQRRLESYKAVPEEHDRIHDLYMVLRFHRDIAKNYVITRLYPLIAS